MTQQLNTTTNPFDQLRQEFKQEISELKQFISLSINANNSGKNNLDDDDIIEIDQASIISRYSKPAIYAKVKSGEIPNIRKGRKILFSRKDLNIWLQQGRKITLSEIQRQSERVAPAK